MLFIHTLEKMAKRLTTQEFVAKAIAGATNKSTQIQWLPKVYWGASAGIPNISALSGSALAASRVGSFTATATAGQKLYFAIPASFGTPTFAVNGFIGGFQPAGTYIVVNSKGISLSYTLWESVNTGLGSTTVVVT